LDERGFRRVVSEANWSNRSPLYSIILLIFILLSVLRSRVVRILSTLPAPTTICLLAGSPLALLHECRGRIRCSENLDRAAYCKGRSSLSHNRIPESTSILRAD